LGPRLELVDLRTPATRLSVLRWYDEASGAREASRVADQLPQGPWRITLEIFTAYQCIGMDAAEAHEIFTRAIEKATQPPPPSSAPPG
jgi:hypothetical protein